MAQPTSRPIPLTPRIPPSIAPITTTPPCPRCASPDTDLAPLRLHTCATDVVWMVCNTCHHAFTPSE
jgi:hypothetical protein